MDSPRGGRGGTTERATLSELAGILWVGSSAVLFGSQFVLHRLCRDLPPVAHNVTMALGVLAGGLAALVPLGWSAVAPGLAALWGVLLFRELAGLPSPRAACVRFPAGAACTVAGIALLTAA